MPQQVHRPVYRVDERDHVLELALYRVVRATAAALAAAAPVHGVDGEVLLQFGQDECPG